MLWNETFLSYFQALWFLCFFCVFYLGIFKVNLNPWHGKNEPPISAHRGSGYWAIELCAILEPLEGVQIGAISQLEQAIEVNRLAHYHIWWNLDLADDDGGRILEVADTLVVATLGFWNWIGSKRIRKNSLFSRINHWFPPIISNICLLESFQMIHSGFPKKRSNFWHIFPDSKNWGKYGSKNPFEKKVTTPFLWDGLLMLLFIRCTYNKKEAVHNFIGLIYVPSSSLCFTTAQAVAWKFSSLSF